MEKFIKIIRVIGLILLIVLALAGIGVGGVGPALPRSRERMIAKANTEQVDKIKEVRSDRFEVRT